MKRITVLGSGSFGTALGALLSGKGLEVRLWGRNASQLEAMAGAGENSRYLPGVKLPETLIYEADLESALKAAEMAVFAVPAQSFREMLSRCRGLLPEGTVIVNVAKGIEQGSLMRLSEVARDAAPEFGYAALSGPSHAEEVARRLPTTVAVASRDKELAGEVQRIFGTDRFRVYTNDDLTGVELGGALKNIIALGAGISDGCGFGDNAKAAIMTRGMWEMCRLGVAAGAEMKTFSGLTGIGDLIVTCTSMHSRNRRCGILMGGGKSPEEAVKEVGMVVEGMTTAKAAYQLAEKYGVEMPITECINEIIDGRTGAKEAAERLMGRSMKNEMH